MIPYFELHVIHLGPLPIQVWGFFAAAGILLGTWIAARIGKERGLSTEIIWDASFWTILGGIVGARFFYLAFYAPLESLLDPLSVFAIWNGGMSIMGGFLGAMIGGGWYLRHQKVDVYAYASAGVFGLPFGLFLGRIGCFLIHDHPGTASHFFLAVKNPDGEGGFHDLGLYDALVSAGIGMLFLVLHRKKVASFWYVPLFLILYGLARIFLDTLRISDARYATFTPAQYVSVGFILAGGVLCGQKRRENLHLSDKN